MVYIFMLTKVHLGNTKKEGKGEASERESDLEKAERPRQRPRQTCRTKLCGRLGRASWWRHGPGRELAGRSEPLGENN